MCRMCRCHRQVAARTQSQPLRLTRSHVRNRQSGQITGVRRDDQHEHSVGRLQCAHIGRRGHCAHCGRCAAAVEGLMNSKSKGPCWIVSVAPDGEMHTIHMDLGCTFGADYVLEWDIVAQPTVCCVSKWTGCKYYILRTDMAGDWS